MDLVLGCLFGGEVALLFGLVCLCGLLVWTLLFVG